jgi:hypothetical protein
MSMATEHYSRVGIGLYETFLKLLRFDILSFIYLVMVMFH